MEDINIITLTKSLLRESLNNNTHWDSKGYVPFSKSKALWLLRNNRIKDDDVCAVIGLENKKIISFIFLVPDFINTKTGTEKIFWSRRWWIAEKYKDSVLPTYTMSVAMNAINNKVLIKFLGKEVVEYYKKQPFTEFAYRTRYYIMFNLDTNLLISKVKYLKYFKAFLRIIDQASLHLVTKLNRSAAIKKTKEFSYEYVSYIDETLWSYINPFCKNDLIPKTKEYINWQIDNNQYTNALTNNKQPFKCLLNSIQKRVYNINYIVKINNKTIGFTSFLIRGKEAIVRYFICENENLEKCADALLENISLTQVSNLQTENKKLGSYLQKKYTNIYTNKRELYALGHNDLNIYFGKAPINDRDGNFA